MKSKNSRLFFKSIWTDIKEMTIIEKSILFVVGALLVIISLFDVKTMEFYFGHINGKSSFETFQNVISLLSGITAFAGIINVYLVAKKKLSNYFWGIIGVTMYGITAFSNAYTGDAILNIFFYLPFNIAGIFLWLKHYKNSKHEVAVKRTTTSTLILWTSVLALLWIGFFYLIPAVDEWFRQEVTGDTASYAYSDKIVPHLMDSFTNAASIIASVWMIIRIKEQWILWIVINVVQLIMWAGIGQDLSINMIIMWSIFLLNSVYGYYNWRKNNKNIQNSIK